MSSAQAQPAVFADPAGCAERKSQRQLPAEVDRKLEGQRMPQLSFSADIKSLFRAIDISHMKRFGVELDDYAYMSNLDNVAFAI